MHHTGFIYILQLQLWSFLEKLFTVASVEKSRLKALLCNDFHTWFCWWVNGQRRTNLLTQYQGSLGYTSQLVHRCPMELSAWKMGKSKEFHSKQNKADGWGMIDKHGFLSFFTGMKLCSYPAFWPRVVNQTHGITCTLHEDLCVFQKHVFLPFKDDLWHTIYVWCVKCAYKKSLAAAFENF